jgi:hypothetical protein
VAQLKKYWFLILIFVLLVFGWGFSTWLTARLYVPDNPVVNSPGPAPKPDGKETKFPISRYEALLGGRLFFGEVKPVTVAFKSNLLLWGVIKGTENRVVVGANPNQTWVVRAGETVEGEQIIAIGDNYIQVRNQTGEGTVMLSN